MFIGAPPCSDLFVFPCVLTFLLILKDMFLKDKKNVGQSKPRLFTVGRLDVATTGLIIVTNDGICSFFA